VFQRLPILQEWGTKPLVHGANLVRCGKGQFEREGGSAIRFEERDVPAVTVHEVHEDAVGVWSLAAHDHADQYRQNKGESDPQFKVNFVNECLL
jgi:hypothetical protein